MVSSVVLGPAGSANTMSSPISEPRATVPTTSEPLVGLLQSLASEPLGGIPFRGIDRSQFQPASPIQSMRQIPPESPSQGVRSIPAEPLQSMRVPSEPLQSMRNLPLIPDASPVQSFRSLPLPGSPVQSLPASPLLQSRNLTMGLDLDNDGRVDKLNSGPIGVDLDNDGVVDVIITPEQLREMILERGGFPRVPPPPPPQSGYQTRFLPVFNQASAAEPPVKVTYAEPITVTRPITVAQPPQTLLASRPPPTRMEPTAVRMEPPRMEPPRMVPTRMEPVASLPPAQPPMRAPVLEQPPVLGPPVLDPPTIPPYFPEPQTYLCKPKVTLKQVEGFGYSHVGEFPYHDPFTTGCGFIETNLPATSYVEGL